MENKYNKTQFSSDATGEQNTKQKLLEPEAVQKMRKVMRE